MLGITTWNSNVHKISTENLDKEAESDFRRDKKKNRFRTQIREGKYRESIQDPNSCKEI
jgi:hypothetical protein